MRKKDLVSKALGLAIAGILAGGLAAAQSSTDKPKSPTAKPSADKNGCGGPNGCGTKASDTKAAASDKHVCKGMNACKGKGACKAGDQGCSGKNSCKGKGGCAVPPKKS